MNCPSCNSFNPADNKFCTSCGKPINSVNTKVCKNGHVYNAGLDKCPYCPSVDLQSKIDKGLAGVTDTFNPSKRSNDSTKIMESGPSKNLNKTVIVSPSGGPGDSLPETAGKKLVGWLVSFTWQTDGEDFRLYEGRNLISGDPKAEIYLPDPAVSSPHCMILFRGGKIKIKDELSTNGTLVNGIEIEETEIKDGDIILVGRTELKFRSI